MCWFDNTIYYVAAFVLLVLVLVYVSSERFGEFKSALGAQNIGGSERFSVTNWRTSNLGTILTNFAPLSQSTEHLRCPKNVDPLETQFMSKMSFLSARNPCK